MDVVDGRSPVGSKCGRRGDGWKEERERAMRQRGELLSHSSGTRLVLCIEVGVRDGEGKQ
jgi:hypothetical protein